MKQITFILVTIRKQTRRKTAPNILYALIRRVRKTSMTNTNTDMVLPLTYKE